VCDLRVTGVDKQATKLNGGADGVYKLSGCYDHRPKYVRESSPKGGMFTFICAFCSPGRAVNDHSCSFKVPFVSVQLFCMYWAPHGVNGLAWLSRLPRTL
jgi:hypothetical protein